MAGSSIARNFRRDRVAPDNLRPGCSSEAGGSNVETSPAASAWSDIPPQLLEAVVTRLVESVQGSIPKDVFSVVGVCKSWHAAGHVTVFNNSWQRGGLIQHPAQLLSLCPLHHAQGGHIKCYIRREPVSTGLSGSVYRFRMFQGAEHTSSNSKFLLGAVQDGPRGYAIYLNRSCSGQSVARLTGNVMGTAFVLTTAPFASNAGSSSFTATAPFISSTGTAQHRSSTDYSNSVHSFQAGSNRNSMSSSAGSSRPVSHSMDSKRSSRDGVVTLPHGVMYSVNADDMQLDPYADNVLTSCYGCHLGMRQEPDELLRVTYKLQVRSMILPRRVNVVLPAPAIADSQQPGAAKQTCDCRRRCSSVSPFAGYAASTARTGNSNLHSTPESQQKRSVADCQNAAEISALEPCSTSLCGSHQPQQQQQEQQSLQYLRNKPPHWNEGLRCWCLNFRGRVKLASVKNFQLITDQAVQQGQQDAHVVVGLLPCLAPESAVSRQSGSSSNNDSIVDPADVAGHDMFGNDVVVVQQPQQQQHQQEERGPFAHLQGSAKTSGIVTQFGKVEKNTFILDYDPVLMTGLQAFALALTTFGIKVLL